MKEHQAEAFTLYIVATPIGNLSDISFRAKEVLKTVDYIASEDTRVTKKLIKALSISKKLISLHEHSSSQKLSSVIKSLKKGSSVAYVSDAGTPGICDPGAALIKKAHETSVRVVPLPGPSALTCIVSVSGMQANTITFHGFFPRKEKEKKKLWEKIALEEGMHFFFESPKRMEKSLSFLEKIAPQVEMTCGREISKAFERIHHGPVESIKKKLQEEAIWKGEFSFVLHIKKKEKKVLLDEKFHSFLLELSKLGANRKLLIRIAQEYGFSKKEAYAISLKYK